VIASAVEASVPTVARVPKRADTEGVEAALQNRPPREAQRCKLDSAGRQSSELATTAKGWQPSRMKAAAPSLVHSMEEDIEGYLDHNPSCRIVIVDTFTDVKGPGRPGRPFEEDKQSLAGVHDLAARRRVAIVLIHHMRQMPAPEGSWVDAVAHSEGVIAAADTTIGLFGRRGEPEAVLRTLSRDAPDRDIRVCFDDATCQWGLMDDAEQFSGSENERAIVRLLAEQSSGLTPRQVAEATAINHQTVKTILHRGAKTGKFRREWHGVYYASGETVKPTPAQANAGAKSAGSSPGFTPVSPATDETATSHDPVSALVHRPALKPMKAPPVHLQPILPPSVPPHHGRTPSSRVVERNQPAHAAGARTSAPAGVRAGDRPAASGACPAERGDHRAGARERRAPA
jgi:hypothetical protein